MYPGIYGSNAPDPCASIWCHRNDLLCPFCIYRSIRFKDGLFWPFQQHHIDDRTDDRSCDCPWQDKPDPPSQRCDEQASGKKRGYAGSWFMWHDNSFVSADGTGRMYFRYASVYPDL